MPVTLLPYNERHTLTAVPISQPRKSSKGRRNGRSQDSSRQSNSSPYPAAALRPLNSAGISRLRSSLTETFAIHPRQPSYPILEVQPEELIRFLLSRIAMATGEREPMVEIHGGVASGVVDVSEAKIAESPLYLHRDPTDFDCRFILGHDGVAFEYCRNMLEEFLFLKLSSKIGELYSGPALRFVYFTKHAIIANTLSVMSIGNPETGKNIDVEFVHARNRPRVYFDDANSCIIPITLLSLGSSRFSAATLCGDFDQMVSLRRYRLLQVPRFIEITNGLPLYIHATLDKGFSAPAKEDGVLCAHFCQAFVAECQNSMYSGRDPTSLLQSFMRSHYPMQPTACLAMVVSVVVNLLLHCGEAELSYLRPNLSELMCRYLGCVADVLDEGSDEDACAEIVSTLLICHYLAHPALGDSPSLSPYDETKATPTPTTPPPPPPASPAASETTKGSSNGIGEDDVAILARKAAAQQKKSDSSLFSSFSNADDGSCGSGVLSEGCYSDCSSSCSSSLSASPTPPPTKKKAGKSSAADMSHKTHTAHSRLFALPPTSSRRVLYLQKRTSPPQSREMAALLINDISNVTRIYRGAVTAVSAKLRCILVAVAAVLACDRSDPASVTSFACLELTRALVNEDLSGEAFAWVFEGSLGSFMTKEDRCEAVSLIDAACSANAAGKRRRKQAGSSHSSSSSHHAHSSVSGLPAPPSSVLPRRVRERRSQQRNTEDRAAPFMLGRPAGITSFLLGAMSFRSAAKPTRQHGLRC